jgi:uncharacterized RDD family membrane protein YckC
MEPSIEAKPPSDAPPVEPPVGEPAPSGWATKAPVVGVPGAPGFVFASVSARLVAYIVDALIVGTAGAAVAIALGFSRVSADTGYMTSESPAVYVTFGLLGFAYFVIFWTGGRRATPGQRMFDIQVGNAFDGRPLTFEQAVRRWVGYGSVLGLLAIIPRLSGPASLLSLVWVVILLATTARSPTKQGLHDRFANSALVRPSTSPSSGPALACLIVVVLLVILIAIGILAALVYLTGEFAPRPPLDTPI